MGTNKSLNFNLNRSFHYSIPPPLHDSSRLPQEGKEYQSRLMGNLKPGTSLSSWIYGLHFLHVSATMFGDVGLRISDCGLMRGTRCKVQGIGWNKEQERHDALYPEPWLLAPDYWISDVMMEGSEP